MSDMQGRTTATHVFDIARREMPHVALAAACRTATDRAGHLTGHGYALHAPDASLIDPACPDAVVRIVETVVDPALSALGLVLSRVETLAASRLEPKAEIAIIALRAGLLARLLDLAFEHLRERESFGRKTLQHQLVKARFSDTGAFLGQLREEVGLSQDRGRIDGAERLHNGIDTQTAQAAKLMGGHGLRAGSIHGLEYASGLLRAIFAARSHSGI